MAVLSDAVPVQRPRSRRRRGGRRHPDQLHVLTFHNLAAPTAGFRPAATVLVRGRMGQMVAIGLGRGRASELGQAVAFCFAIRTVPAPRPTPGLDKLCARYTAFASFLLLLTAAGGYRPSIRLDLLGRGGLALACTYDRQQAAWGNDRRAYVTGACPTTGAGMTMDTLAEPALCPFCCEPERVELFETWGQGVVWDTCCEALHHSLVEEVNADPAWGRELLRRLGAEAYTGHWLRRLADDGGCGLLLDW